MSATPEITRIDTPSHETVLRVRNAALGLTGFIALHSTRLGPAAGGLRMRPYTGEDAALTDALRLSEGMTCKNAAAGLPLGGGKAVIMGDPATRTPDQLRAFARAIDTLGGRYWTAEDMGLSPADMAVMAGETRYVAGLRANSTAAQALKEEKAKGFERATGGMAYLKLARMAYYVDKATYRGAVTKWIDRLSRGARA